MKITLILIFLVLTKSQYAQSTEEILTNVSIINLYNSGLSTSVIISKIKISKVDFDIRTEALLNLKSQNIPDEIVNAMVDASTKNTVQNDPNSEHESGIYYYKYNTGNAEMIFLEPTVCTQSKSGSGIGTSLTYGMGKTKNKAVLDGDAARLQLNDTSPVFYFYFEKGANLNTSSTWFSASSSPNEFILVKLDIKKKSREFVNGSYNAYGSSWGVDDKYKISFEIERVKTGVYKVIPAHPLDPGEYCFMYGGNNSVANGSGKVFDFGTTKE